MTKIFTLSLMLMFTYVATARDFTKPTSIALRSEVSFVAEATLTEKKFVDADEWLLTFKVIEDIHNKSPSEITTLVQTNLAMSLAVDVNYVIAYETSRKTKVKGVARYLPLKNGPTLMRVEGGNPAIYRSDKRIKQQLLTDPKLAKTDPNQFIEMIMAGIQASDPKIQEFFIRELINWIGLPEHLSQAQLKSLLSVFNSNESSIGTFTALLENRPNFHQSLGIKNMTPQVINFLETLPIQTVPDSDIPGLILQALNFSIKYKTGTWDIYSRWTRSNVPSITEKALLALSDINQEHAIKLAQERLNETHLSDTSRRVLLRYVMNKNKQ